MIRMTRDRLLVRKLELLSQNIIIARQLKDRNDPQLLADEDELHKVKEEIIRRMEARSGP